MSRMLTRKRGSGARRLSIETLKSRALFALDLDSPLQGIADQPIPPEFAIESDPGAVASAAAASSENWISAGPTAIPGGQTENIPGNRVSGAVNALLLHPTNANLAWIGTTNGGIWTTSNLTTTNPTWTARTDESASLSVGALTPDLADATFNRLWAGVGRFSSSSGDGGARSGLFRSTNGGSSFVQLNGASGTGLPLGLSYDLVVDPINTNILYSSIWGGTADGIYKSINSGATWSRVSSTAINNQIGSVTSNIELAVGRNNNVYAGIINQGVLSGLYRSGNGGASWTKLDTPVTNENGNIIGIHPRPKGPGLGSTPSAVAGGQGCRRLVLANRQLAEHRNS